MVSPLRENDNRRKKMNTRNKTFNMVLTALFMAIIIIMAFVPNVGYINLVVIKATLIHVPVIVGSIVLGPKLGSILGATFGVTSLINNTINPSLLSFAFSPFYQIGDVGGNGWSIVIALVPRILVGVVPYFVFKLIMLILKNLKGKTVISLAVAGVAGAFTNTLLVMNMIYFCFREEFAAAKEIAVEAVYDVILGIIAANGIPEAIVGGIFAVIIGGILLKIMPKDLKK